MLQAIARHGGTFGCRCRRPGKRVRQIHRRTAGYGGRRKIDDRSQRAAQRRRIFGVRMIRTCTTFTPRSPSMEKSSMSQKPPPVFAKPSTKGRWHWRRIHQRQVRVSQGLRSDPPMNGPASDCVSRLDARFHRRAHPPGPWELHPLDARHAAKSRRRSRRSFRHRTNLRPPAIRNERCRADNGISDWK